LSGKLLIFLRMIKTREIYEKSGVKIYFLISKGKGFHSELTGIARNTVDRSKINRAAERQHFLFRDRLKGK